MPFVKIKQKANRVKSTCKSVEKEKFYNTQQWRDLKKQCIAKCFGIDVYSYYEYNLIEYGQTVHHIKPVSEYPKLKADISNLIYLTESNHQKIHKMMKDGINPKLEQYIERFQKEFLLRG